MKKYFIENLNGMRVGVLNFGAYLTNIELPLKEGGLKNVVLNYWDIEKYKRDTFYLGATIGRYANRIKNGVFSLGNRKHKLSLNEFNNHNHLHGGFYGFNTKLWEVDEYNAHSISLSYLSIDGEEGYPGNVQVYVTFTLDDTNSLLITYKARSDQDTVLNLSNHSYFNLGNHQESIHNHRIQVFSDRYTPLDENYIPIGCIEEVENTNYDLINEKKVLEIEGSSSFNANYCFSTNKQQLVKMAALRYGENNRTLLIESTYPGLQVYFGNFLSSPFKVMNGLCLEPQYYPDSPNNKVFPSPLLKAGEAFQQSIKYSFKNF